MARIWAGIWIPRAEIARVRTLRRVSDGRDGHHKGPDLRVGDRKCSASTGTAACRCTQVFPSNRGMQFFLTGNPPTAAVQVAHSKAMAWKQTIGPPAASAAPHDM